MDLLSMLADAQVNDLNGLELGRVLVVHISSGKLSLTVDIEAFDTDDPDDGAKDDIPENDASKTPSSIIEMMNRVNRGSENG